jgi:hypothetical protein
MSAMIARSITRIRTVCTMENGHGTETACGIGHSERIRAGVQASEQVSQPPMPKGPTSSMFF